MKRAASIVLFIIIALLIFVCADSILGLIHPAYTDQEIQASLVDTWEVETLATTIFLIFIFSAAVVSAFLAFRHVAATRRLAVFSLCLAVVAGGLVSFSHIELTNRVSQITGQSFGSSYGLF